MNLLRTTFLAALLAAAGTAHAQALPNAPPPPKSETEAELAKLTVVPQVLAKAGEYLKAEDWRRYGFAMQRVLELRPLAANIKLELAAAYAMQEMLPETYDLLVRLQSSGYAFDIEADERFAKARGTGVWDYVVQGFKDNGAESGTGKLAFEMPKDDLLLESLAYDSTRKVHLAGSARTGAIYRVAANGKLGGFIRADADNGLWGVFDLVADPAHDALWVASAAIPHVKHATPIDYGRSGVWRFKLSNGKFERKWLLPDDGKPHMLTALSVNPKGDVFVVDSLLSEIRMLDGAGFKLILRNPALQAVRGVAAAADNKTVYFSDHEQGVFGVDLSTGRAFDMRFPAQSNLFGVDALAYYNGNLVAVQNGVPPFRIARFTLTPDGRGIQRIQGLDSARKAFGALAKGVVVVDKFHVIANSQKGHYDGRGKLAAGAKLEPVRVWESDLHFAWNVDKGEIRAPQQQAQ
jgi:hypothetical protein